MRKFQAALTICITALICVTGVRESFCQPTPVQKRAEVIKAIGQGTTGFPVLRMALQDKDLIVRRTAARGLAQAGKPAAGLLSEALGNDDFEVRRMALLGLESIGALTTDNLATAMGDSNKMLRLEAARILSRMKPRTKQVEELLKRARMDESFEVRDEVLKGITSSRPRKSLREEHRDQLIEVVQSFRLPAEGWKFKVEPDEGSQRTEEWYLKDYNDGGWDTIGIEKAWQGFGYEYTWVACWYRGWFEMPQEVKCDGVEIHFGGVDEGAWVWVNGEYAGGHDIGPAGWDVPFSLDITDFVKWGGKNQITVRVFNTVYAGGIWQPVTINFLKVK